MFYLIFFLLLIRIYPLELKNKINYNGYGINEIKLIKNLKISPILPKYNDNEIISTCKLNDNLPNGLFFNNSNCAIYGIPNEVKILQLVNILINTNLDIYLNSFYITIIDDIPENGVFLKIWDYNELCYSNLFNIIDLPLNDNYITDVNKDLFFENDNEIWDKIGNKKMIEFTGYFFIENGGDFKIFIESIGQYKLIIEDYILESLSCGETYYNISINTVEEYVKYTLYYFKENDAKLKVTFSKHMYPRKIPEELYYYVYSPPRYIQYPSFVSAIIVNTYVSIEPFVLNDYSTNYNVELKLPKGLYINCDTGIISGTAVEVTNPTEYKINCFNKYGSSYINIVIQVINNVFNGLLTNFYKLSNNICGSIPDISNNDPIISLVDNNINYYNQSDLYHNWENIFIFGNYVTVWKGVLVFPTTGKWILTLTAKDEAYLYINNILMISITCNSDREKSYEINVEDTIKNVNMKLIYSRLSKEKYIKLMWRNEYRDLEIIPSTAFYHYPELTVFYTYQKVIYKIDNEITPNIPNIVEFTGTFEYSIIPENLHGLIFDEKTGVISGKPTEETTEEKYIITCNSDILRLETVVIITIISVEKPVFTIKLSDNVVNNVDCSIGISFPVLDIISYNSIEYFISPNLLNGMVIDNKNNIINGKIVEKLYNDYNLVIYGYNLDVFSSYNLHLKINICSKYNIILKLKRYTDYPLNIKVYEEYYSELLNTELIEYKEENVFLICSYIHGIHSLDIESDNLQNLTYSIEYLSGNIIKSGIIYSKRTSITFTDIEETLEIYYQSTDFNFVINENIDIKATINGYYTIININPTLPEGLILYNNGSIKGVVKKGYKKTKYDIEICNIICVKTSINLYIEGCNNDKFYYIFNIESQNEQNVQLKKLSNSNVLFNESNKKLYSKGICEERDDFMIEFGSLGESVISISDVEGDILYKNKIKDKFNSKYIFSTNFIIEPKSIWNYYIPDNNIDKWYNPTFDSSLWMYGKYDTFSLSKTTYFRKKFTLNEMNSGNNILTIGVKSSSCYVIYINGYKIHKENIDDEFNYETKCQSCLYNSNAEYNIFTTLSSFLFKGENVISVEIHSCNTNYNVFDLYMTLFKYDENRRDGLMWATLSFTPTTDNESPSNILNENDLFETSKSNPKICINSNDYETITGYNIFFDVDDHPENWNFYGSNKVINCMNWNINDWILLDNQNYVDNVAIISVNNTVPYKYYSFSFTKNTNMKIKYIKLNIISIDLDNFCITEGWSISTIGYNSYGKCSNINKETSRKCDNYPAHLQEEDMSNCLEESSFLKYNQHSYNKMIGEEINIEKPEYHTVSNGIFEINPSLENTGLSIDSNTGEINGIVNKDINDIFIIAYGNDAGKAKDYVNIYIDISKKCYDETWGYKSPGEFIEINCDDGYDGTIKIICNDGDPPKYGDKQFNCISKPPKSFSYEYNEYTLYNTIYSAEIIPVYEAINVEFSSEKLPEGLKVDQKSGIISGTPGEESDKEYVVTIKNDGGSIETRIRIIIKPIPKFNYGETDYFCKINENCVIKPIEISNVNLLLLSDEVPDGDIIKFDSSNGCFTIKSDKPLLYGTYVYTDSIGYTLSVKIVIHSIYNINISN